MSKEEEVYDDKIKTENVDVCAICLDNLYNGHPRTYLSCAHLFHKLCMNNWVRTRGIRECPLCKTIDTRLEQELKHCRRAPRVQTMNRNEPRFFHIVNPMLLRQMTASDEIEEAERIIQEQEIQAAERSRRQFFSSLCFPNFFTSRR